MNSKNTKERMNKILAIFCVMALLLVGAGVVVKQVLKIDPVGPVLMFQFALCFIIIAIWSARNWWSIIPGGIFATLGIISLLENFVPHADFIAPPHTLEWGVFNWVLFLGLAVTFGILWLLRKTQPTNWASYPAAGLLIIAITSLFLGSRFQVLWQETTILAVALLSLLFLLKKMQRVRN